ncbi:MAG: GatB/YqeY domain-containing protein, partial [Methanobrevibacter sp.]|nr:GatB/YqeY domain-containing protein [Methanobrevibacter sp.]
IAISALEEVKRRANLGFEGVVEETRKSLDDGNTEYMRPLPTANRMYLETDIPLFKIDEEMVENIKNNLPELPDEKKARIIKEYSLSDDLATQLVKNLVADKFEVILKAVKVDPTPVASLLAYDLKDFKRDGYDIDILKETHLIDIFTLLSEEKIAKDSVNKLTIAVIENPNEEIEVIAENNNLTLLNTEKVQEIIADIVSNNAEMVKERQMGAMGPLMGMSMKQLKGKADGSVVNKIVKEEIQKLL